MSRVLSVLAITVLVLSGLWAQNGATQFVYLSDQRIVTLELVDSNNLILNYINLGDSFEMLEAPMVALVDSSGRHFNGHLISLEESEDQRHRYKISELMKPGTFSGYLIVGNFRTTNLIERALLQISGRILELEPLSGDEFELLAARIGEIDLAIRERKGAIERAGFSRGFGELFFAGTEEAKAVEVFFGKDPVLAPVTLANPSPLLPSSESSRPDPVVVRVKAVVSRQGGLRDIHLAEGINPKLDEIALETVRNSWVFLPAISNNEIVEAEVTLNILFRRE